MSDITRISRAQWQAGRQYELRELHGIHIEIYANASGWGWILTKCGGNGSVIKEIENHIFFSSYEKALHIGIIEAEKYLKIKA